MRTYSVLTVLVAVVLAAFAFAGCGGDDDDEASGDDVTVELAEESGSGQTGTATLTTSGEQTVVSITVDDPVSDSQPAHIHEGSCGESLNPEPAFGLPNVADGSSETTVDVPLTTLTDGEYAINLHMSDEDLATYTSCGNIEG